MPSPAYYQPVTPRGTGCPDRRLVSVQDDRETEQAATRYCREKMVRTSLGILDESGDLASCAC
jgi:hypothetical protein